MEVIAHPPPSAPRQLVLGPEPPTRPLRLEFAGPILTLVTLLIPITGVLARFTGFTVSGVVSPWLASAAPLPDLAAAGLVALTLPALFGTAAMAAGFALASHRARLERIGSRVDELQPDRIGETLQRLRARREQRDQALDAITQTLREVDAEARAGADMSADDPTRQEWKRRLDEAASRMQALKHESDAEAPEFAAVEQDVKDATELLEWAKKEREAAVREAPFPIRIARSRWSSILLVVNLLVSASVAIFLLPVQHYLTTAISVFLFVYVGLRISRGPIRFRDVALPITLAMLVGALLSGLYLAPIVTADVRFRPSSASVESGEYLLVGESPDYKYLVPCSSPDRLLGVPTADIRLFNPLPRRSDFVPRITSQSAFSLLFLHEPFELGLQIRCRVRS